MNPLAHAFASFILQLLLHKTIGSPNDVLILNNVYDSTVLYGLLR
jgi:hypothetical protein